MREGKIRRAPKLPPAERRRPDLVHEHRCGACGFLMGTTDLNDSSHFRADVARGARGPVDPRKLERVHREFAALRMVEECPCGAIYRHEPALGEGLLGTRAVRDRQRERERDKRRSRTERSPSDSPATNTPAQTRSATHATDEPL